jgi:DoxX-like family
LARTRPDAFYSYDRAGACELKEAMVAATTHGKLVWLGRVISFLPMLLFFFSAFMKLRGGPELDEGMAHLGLPSSMVKPLAILELTCVVVYLIPQTAVLGAILLTGYLGGAICTHWRVGDPFIMQIALGIFIWLGLYLRDSRLWVLIPLRTS